MTDEQDTSLSKAVITYLDGISEAFEDVNALGTPNGGESLMDLHNRLLVTRAAMSRVSELNAQIIRLRSRSYMLSLTRKGELEEAEAKILSEPTKKVLIEDYSSAKERNAKLAAKTIEERRKVRIVEQWCIDLDGALDYSKNRLWELDRAVRDIDTRLRIMAYEPNIH